MISDKFFNVRVYGLLISPDAELLIAEEFHYDTFMRKLPGGGLQFGEGTVDCLIRELEEEMDVTVDNLTHFHTTDFFIQSAFNESHQVIAIYYKVIPPAILKDRFRETTEIPVKNGQEVFKWVKIRNLNWEDFTFPADQAAIKKMKALLDIQEVI